MEKISPEEYRRILDGIELKNILISNIKADLKHELLTEGMKIVIKDDAQYEMREDDFIIKNKYILTAKNQANKIALKIECVFIVVFETKYEITDGFFEIYKDLSLPLNVWPFFRELVNSTTARMNIPPLTLPLLKR
ncbi:MAG TPA: hypothetical protein ENK14_05070 [Caldithrix sp.]|nr:hypothetical protein [Caldithrix sp.]